MKPTISLNLYTLRDFVSNPEDFAETMEKLAGIGYKSVQISGVKGCTPQEILDITKANGLGISAAHIGMQDFEKDFDTQVEKLKLWNCKYVAIPSMPEEYRKDEASFIQFAKDASAIGEKLAAHGIILCYHNHSFEFVRFGDRNGLDIIYDESTPEYLQGEIDTYWIQHGGGCPTAYINKLAGRQPIIHYKDMVIRDGQQVFAEVGAGNLDWDSIVPATVAAGVEYLIVEQDVCPGDPFVSVKISYDNIASWGFE